MDALLWMSISKFKRHSAPFRMLKNQNGETNDKNLNVFDFDKGLLTDFDHLLGNNFSNKCWAISKEHSLAGQNMNMGRM